VIAGFFNRRRFMRDHRWTVAHASPYIDRELDSGGRARIERHSEVCPECHRLLATLGRTVRALRRLGIDEAPPAAPAAPGPVAEEVIGYLRRSG
jgi:anti-sigma factor RsiW